MRPARLSLLSLVVLFAPACSKTETPVPRPSWCKSAVMEIDRTRPLLPARDAMPESLDALAKRMDLEASALGELVPKEGAEPLEATADADSGVSAATEAILKRRQSDAADTGAAERALAVILRERERAVLAVKGQCGIAAPPIEQDEDWRNKAEAIVTALRPQLRACADDVPLEERPTGMSVVVQVDHEGRAFLATAAGTTFDLGQWAATNIAHCMIRRLEATKFPEPKGSATVLVATGP